MFPENNATGVNPDTHLRLSFPFQPIIGDSGMVRIYDADTGQLVDSLDLSVPPGPTTRNKEKGPYTPEPYEYKSGDFTNVNTKPGTPSGEALPTPDDYQLTIIGGFTDGFHFYPIIVRDTVATIYLHHNLLEYDQTYYVQIDSGVLSLEGGNFSGVIGKSEWTFTTKKSPPPIGADRIVVSGDGRGDFNTVQGAIDFIPEDNDKRITIFIRNGRYEEIIYFRNKQNVTFLGEDRDSVLVCYANNEVFNPHPANITTNEWPGTFPSRRAVFMSDNSTGIHLVNFTIESLNDKPAQAEGLLMMGQENIVSNMTIIGSGDALQINGSVYLTDTSVKGFGDNILGRGPAFFQDCELISTYGPHMWIRNTEANHGNVFVNCTFRTEGDTKTVIARAPKNNGITYPYAEAVLLNCAIEGIKPRGWGDVGDTSNVHYWEYNSRNLTNGKPVDVSQRHPVSRQLTAEDDSSLIANYSTPSYVLGGWSPEMAPMILSHPESVQAEPEQTVNFRVNVAAVPQAEYQWYKDGAAIEGATGSTMSIKHISKDDAAQYHARVTNESGRTLSKPATLIVR